MIYAREQSMLNTRSMMDQINKHARQMDAEAEPLCREALEVSRATLGDRHPYTVAFIENLAQLLEKQGKLDEAELLRRGMQQEAI